MSLHSYILLVFSNRIKEVNVVLQSYDVSINCSDKDGHSSLYWASQQGHVNVVKELFLHSAVVNTRNKKSCIAIVDSKSEWTC